jgi:hypothetical protein
LFPHYTHIKELLLTSAPESLNHSLLTFNDRERAWGQAFIMFI